ncbi:MAG: hypothetical protein WC879_02995 [Melioribacteraceae bacterium]
MKNITLVLFVLFFCACDKAIDTNPSIILITTSKNVYALNDTATVYITNKTDKDLYIILCDADVKYTIERFVLGHWENSNAFTCDAGPLVSKTIKGGGTFSARVLIDLIDANKRSPNDLFRFKFSVYADRNNPVVLISEGERVSNTFQIYMVVKDHSLTKGC